MILRYILKLSGYPIEKAICDLNNDKLIAGNSELYEGWLKDKKWNIFNYHLINTEYYKSKIGNKNIGNWEDIPVMRKTDYQNSANSFMSSEYSSKGVYRGSTSGSSGHPFFFLKDKYCHARTYALIFDRYKQFGINPGMKQARFYGIPLKGKQRIIEQLKDLLMNRVRFPVHDLSTDTLDSFIEKFSSIKFEFIYGYTSSIVQFAKHLINRKLVLKDLCPSLKVAIVTSEMCNSEDMKLIERATGLNVINEYGASEIDIIAISNKDRQWILSVENLYIEILDEQNKPVPNGKEGKIVVTNLFNKAMPFIRYEIGDLGVLNEQNQKILHELKGRQSDLIQLPSGKTAGGLTFYYISRSLLETSGVIREFIVKQKSMDSFLFEVVSERELEKKEISYLKNLMDEYLEDGLNLEIKYVSKIYRPESQKIKHFYSELH